MNYRSPENLIRSIMAKSQGTNLNEDIGTQAHMNPALKTPEEERLTAAANILKNHGCPSAKVEGNSVSVNAMDMNKAADVLERALAHGLITVRPELSSPEAIAVPEPHVPAPEFAKEEVINEGKKTMFTVANGRTTVELGDNHEKVWTHKGHTLYRNKDNPKDHMLIDKDNKVHSMFEGGTDDVKHMIKGAGLPALRKGLKEGNMDLPDAKDEEDQTPEAKIEDGIIKLEPRTLRNRMENQMKKVDEAAVNADINRMARDILNKNKKVDQVPEVAQEEVEKKAEVEQIDELSTETLKKVADSARKKNRPDVLKAAIKAHQRNRSQPKYEGPPMAKHEETDPITGQQLDELSLKTLTVYGKAAKKPRTPLDKKIDSRRKGLKMAQKKIGQKVSKAMFGEDATPLNMVLRVRALAEASGLRLKATVNSDSGDHHAKIYKDHEWGEHRVKYFIHGKHHEPADSHHSDYDDAHDTAKMELKRLDKLSGALKESTVEDVEAFLNGEEQIDELSRVTLSNYIKKSANDMAAQVDEGLSSHMKKKGYGIADVSNYVNTGDSGRGYAVPGRDVRVGPKKYAAHSKHTSPPHAEIAPERTDVRKAKKDARLHKIGKLGEEVAKEGETPFLAEANLREVSKKLEHHGYKKFGASDRIDHREILTTYHHPEHGHLISVNHRENGKVNSASALKCTNSETGAMANKWGEDHSHVELALRELGHKSYIGFKEEVEQVDELSRPTLANYVYHAAHKMKSAAADHQSALEAKSRFKIVGNEKGARYAGQNMSRAYREHEKRNKGIERALSKLAKEEVDQLDEIDTGITKVGTYFDNHGNTFSMHRSNADSKHHLLSNAHGDVVDSHYGKAKDFHKKLTTGPGKLSGALHEEVEQVDEVSKSLLTRYRKANYLSQDSLDYKKAVAFQNQHRADDPNEKASEKAKYKELAKKSTKRKRGDDMAFDKLTGIAKVNATEEIEHLDELSAGTLTNYAIKATKSKKENLAKTASELARGNASHGEHETRMAHHNAAAKYHLKAINRHEGIRKATTKLAKKPEAAGVCEDVEQIDERVLSTKSREHLKKKTFGIPSERKYPMPDKKHAANAKARATQMEKKGKLSSSEAAKIRAKANKILGEDIKKKGRPKKARHEDGEIVNDPKANS